MTNIYNITYYPKSDLVYILFEGCNFQCKGCYMKTTKWDYHLPEDKKRCLQQQDCHMLALNEFEETAKKFNVKKAVLGGEEATLDEELPNIVAVLTSLGIKTLLTTNGHALNEKRVNELEKAGLSGARMSIRAIDEQTHQVYTGETNKQVLKNFRVLSESRIKLIAESILIPGLVDINEIEKVAQFVASINPTIPLRLDGFLPFNDVPWRSPSPDEVSKAARAAQKHLWMVNHLHCETGDNGQRVVSIFPPAK